MAQITGGKIFYSQTRQAAQFEPKKAEVELSFIVGEGETFAEIAKMAEDFAVAKVQEMIGAKAVPAARQVQAAPPKPDAPAKAPAMDTTPVTLPGGKEAYAAKEAAAKTTKTSVPKAGKKAETPAISTGDERVNPDDEGIDMGLDDDGLPKEPVAATVISKEITDAELTSAISKVNQKLNDPGRIRAEVARLVGPPPKNSRDLTQAQRPEFIAMIEGWVAK